MSRIEPSFAARAFEAPRAAPGTLTTPGAAAAERLDALAHEALLREVWLTPKPGLVDRRNTGAHRDMTIATFEASAAALRPFFADFVVSGAASARAPAREAFPDLRRIGLGAEAAMRAATGCVNTHKGAIFAFGLLLGAAGRLTAQGRGPAPDPLCDEAAAIVEGIVARDLADRPHTAVTAGEYIYRRYGLTGARGEAQSGFASVRRHGLPAFRSARAQGASDDRAMLAAMVALLAENSDTNLIARGGPAGAEFVRREAARIAVAGPFAAEFLSRLEAMDDALIARNLSPGGTADLVGLTWFLARLADGVTE